MNKKVIKKYKTEFDWWLDGGSTLFRDMRNEWKTTHSDGREFQISKYPFVINDKYVSWRKAEAEGKTIQYKLYNTTEYLDCLLTDQVFIQQSAEDYRIKPDEPEFSVGDYVYHKSGEILQLTSFSGNNFNCTPDRTTGGQWHKSYLSRLWTLNDALDDDWLVCLRDGAVPVLITKKELSAQLNNFLKFNKVVPYVGQTPAQLGL